MSSQLLDKTVANMLSDSVSGYYQLTFEQQKIAHSVYSVEGQERLDQPWQYQVVFTTASKIEHRTLLREAVSLSFTPNIKESIHKLSTLNVPVLPRLLYGVVTEFEHVSQSKEGYHYSITIEPRLALLQNNKRSAIYQHQSIVSVVEQILREHGFTGVDYRLELQADYPTKEFIVQWQESDLAFIQRLLADNGIWFRFESHLKHNKEVMVLCDNNESAEQIKTPILYNPPSSLLDGGVFSVWGMGIKSRIISGVVLAKDYNYQASDQDLSANVAVAACQNEHRNTVYGVDYEYGLDYKENNSNVDGGEWLAKIRAQRHECTQYLITGKSNDYRLAVGQHIKIKDCPLDFAHLLITSIRGLADRNNSYELEFTAIAYEINQPYRPALLPVPTIHTTIPAKVMSPDNDTYGYIDTQGRYRVKFIFDLTYWKAGEESVWLRFAKPYSGDKCGFHFPLIDGTEVAVAFVNGHPDRPFIAHAMHNSTHPDVVTTQNKHQNILKTAASNLLEMDDKRGKEHIALSTEYGKSQLNLGHLVHNSGTSNDQRGHGFELRTDEWGTIRAAKGLYLSANERTKAQGSQLDLAESISILEQALQVAKGLAHASKTAGSPEADVRTQENQLASSYTDLKKSAILLNAPNGIGITSSQSVQLSSGENITFTTAKSIDGSSQQDIRLASQDNVSLFALRKNMHLVSNQGQVNVLAQHNSMDIAAQKALKIMSTEDSITIAAEKEVVLTSGGASIRIGSGKITLEAPGVIDLKAGSLNLGGGGSMSFPLPAFSLAEGKYNMRMIFTDDDGKPYINTPYVAIMPNGKELKGVTNEDGLTQIFYSDQKEEIKVHLDIAGQNQPEDEEINNE